MKDSDLQKALHKIDLEEAILEKHGVAGPSTHKRNSNSAPINGTLKTPGIVIDKGGYFGYNEVFQNTDHRCIWIDVQYSIAFRHNSTPTMKRTRRRLHCKEPRLVSNYVHLYHQYAGPLQLFERVNHLDANAKSMPKIQVIQEYEELDRLRCLATTFAESKCRKLHTGQVAFCEHTCSGAIVGTPQGT
jgi:hypothetical protein